jgi:hypothetical protein
VASSRDAAEGPAKPLASRQPIDLFNHRPKGVAPNLSSRPKHRGFMRCAAERPASAVAVAFAFASEIGPGFIPDIKATSISGFSPWDKLSCSAAIHHRGRRFPGSSWLQPRHHQPPQTRLKPLRQLSPSERIGNRLSAQANQPIAAPAESSQSP